MTSANSVSTPTSVSAYQESARRVAYVHDTTVYGGVEVFLLQLMKHLDPRRYEPVVIVPTSTDPHLSSPPLFVQQIRDAGIPLIKLPIRSQVPGIGRVSQLLATARLFKANKIDVLHIHTWRPQGAHTSTIGAWLAGILAIVRTEHLPPTDVPFKVRAFVQLLDRITDCVITVSDAALESQVAVLRRNRRKLYRSHGGIDVERFSRQRDPRNAKLKLGLAPDVPVVGFVGRLSPQKGLAYLVPAARRVVRRYGPVTFLMVGEGPLEQQLQRQADELNLSQHFRFVGFKQEVELYMDAMDIGVLPSLWEAFPLVLLEYMAMGIPTVTSALPCFREAVIDGESGLVTSLDDAHGLADSILHLLLDPDHAARIGQAAQERVRAHFTVQRLANDMMDLYDRVLATKVLGRDASHGGGLSASSSTLD